MDTMDLQVAILAHLNWKSRLSDFFYGVEDLSAGEVPDHTSCDFGKWLYSIGMQEFSRFPEMSSLESLHKDVHDNIKRLVATPKEKRMTDEGKQMLTEFKQKCDRFVDMLKSIKAQAERV